MKAYKYFGNNGEEQGIVLFDEANFTKMNECETYDRFGQKVGCENAGCFSPDNHYCDCREGDRITHTECEAFNYWNGSNWQTLILEGSGEPNMQELDDEESDAIIKAFDEAEFQEKGFGKSKAKTETYNFHSTSYATDPFIAWVDDENENEDE